MRKKAEKVFLSDAVIRDEQQEIKRLERMLKEDRASGRNKISDEAAFQREIEEKKKKIEKHIPHKLTGRKQNEAYKKAKKLKTEIQEVLQSEKKFNLPYPSSGATHKKERDFEDAVEHEMRILKDSGLQRKMGEYKALMAQIDPQDPRVRNIENLRR